MYHIKQLIGDPIISNYEIYYYDTVEEGNKYWLQSSAGLKSEWWDKTNI